MGHRRVTHSGPVAVQSMIDSKELPEAGPVKTYRLDTVPKVEEFETKVARNLQAIIRIGRPQMKVEMEAREEAIRGIIVACCKELEGNHES